MYAYKYDPETGGLLLTTSTVQSSKEPRPVYYKELDLLGFNRYWKYKKSDAYPYMWAESNKYYYRGREVAQTNGGALYAAPEIEIKDVPEPKGKYLRFVDVPAMVEKNRDLLEKLVQDTIKKVYNTYVAYRKKVDLFYVAFSGGKDSIVTLDIVQRALPHNSFVVVFGDTKMEFKDTYDAVNKIRQQCKADKIPFLVANSDLSPVDAWQKFGPPCSTNRWCCSVFKTAPQIIKLREYLNAKDFCGMALVGVRAAESLKRSKYEYVSLGEKHKGQYSCNVILDWNSAEVYLYSYAMKLVFNETYKKGNSRAGCLICPRAAERNDFMNHSCYRDESEQFVDIIRWSYQNAFSSADRLEQFIQSGGWKARKNGRDLVIDLNYNDERLKDGSYVIKVNQAKSDWKTWIKTIGTLESKVGDDYVILFHNLRHSFTLHEEENGYTVYVPSETVLDVEFISLFKQVFRKAACCVGCRECQADCPFGCLTFENGIVVISDKCRHCSQCHKTDKGCLVYKSLERPRGTSMNKTASLNSYSHFAPKLEWIEQYFTFKNDFKTNHTLGKNMYDFFIPFLRHAGLLDENGFSHTASILDNLGLRNEATWGVMLVNLAYTRQVQWVISTTPFNIAISRKELSLRMVEDGAKESWTGDVFASITRLGELPFGDMGFGKTTKIKREAWFERTPWANPEAKVILYSLYKFAEACGGYYQFTLTRLLDFEVESDGMSPAQIFGLDRQTLTRLLTGLGAKYSDFITAQFTLNLDTITLNAEKTSADVLTLF